jgi:trk system potassium uptake protein TrkH
MQNRPALLTVFAFLAAIVAGTLALYALGLGRDHHRDWIDAAFTSTSAVCVTGLSVVDLATETETPAQVVILILMQVGGLGVLTLSNWILLALRRRIGLGGSTVTRETFGGLPHISPTGMLWRVALFTLSVEAVGAGLLWLAFARDASLGQAAWLAVFHSVSAFCNAGFSLFSDSLEGYRGDIFVNAVIMGLIVLGGIGFVVAADVVDWVRGRFQESRRHLLFHTRVVLIVSGALTAVGFLGALIFEWGNTFTGDSPASTGLEAIFLSVTARTAGFNTVETGHLTNMTLVHLMLLMMVGASPGSTGGGVKTTTFAIVWARVRGHLLNRPDTEMLGRRVPREYVAKAMAIVLIYALVAMVAVVALQGTEYGELPHDQTRGTFLEHFFEVISALSTVGLSTGVTTALSDPGLFVILACMFIGRVGPLVLAGSLIGERPRRPHALPQGDVLVG